FVDVLYYYTRKKPSWRCFCKPLTTTHKVRTIKRTIYMKDIPMHVTMADLNKKANTIITMEKGDGGIIF
ncbi:MAG: hypothetical protein V3T17_11330, partial [Pseudomonadales bacterium]